MSQVTFCDVCDITKEKTKTLIKWIGYHRTGLCNNEYGMYSGIVIEDLELLKAEVERRKKKDDV